MKLSLFGVISMHSPFDKMWADDALWIPLALEGKEFDGQFIFDGENMISHNIIEKDYS